jgi:drug/metabolite transporter (DMT)-like permease
MTIETAPFPLRAERALRGVMLAVSATFLFALADTLGKHLALLYAVTLVLAVRYVINLALITAIMAPRHGAALWHANRPYLMILRGLCLAMASISLLLALRVMPVGEAIAIIYISPFAVMLVAERLLGEKVSLIGWLGAVGGFVGVLLIMRPGSGLDPLGVALTLFNAACATAYVLLTRILTRTEATMSMLFYTALVGAVIFTGMAIFSLDGRVPGLGDAGLMLALGALATAGHLMFTSTYREASASLLAPVNYMHIVFAAILGWLVFDHLPDGWALTGMAMIILSGVVVALRAGR